MFPSLSERRSSHSECEPANLSRRCLYQAPDSDYAIIVLNYLQDHSLKYSLSGHVRSQSFAKCLQSKSDAENMFGRRNFVTAVLVIYLVLIILFFAYKEPFPYSSACIHGSACVRFCCDDHATCSNKFINEHFNDSLVLKYDSEYIHEVKHIFGRPDCSTLKPFEADRQWQFHYVSSYSMILWQWFEINFAGRGCGKEGQLHGAIFLLRLGRVLSWSEEQHRQRCDRLESAVLRVWSQHPRNYACHP